MSNTDNGKWDHIEPKGWRNGAQSTAVASAATSIKIGVKLQILVFLTFKLTYTQTHSAHEMSKMWSYLQI